MESNICMCAEDHQLFEVHKDVKVVQRTLQDTAGVVTDWYEADCLNKEL